MKTLTLTITLPVVCLDCEADVARTVLLSPAFKQIAWYALTGSLAHQAAALIGAERAGRMAAVVQDGKIEASATETTPEHLAIFREGMVSYFGAGNVDRMLRDDAASAAEKSERAEASPVPKAAAEEADALLNQVLAAAKRTDGGAP